MAGIARRLLAEGIAGDDVLPFLRGADKEIRLKINSLRSLGLQQALQLGGASPVRAEDEIPALQQRAHVREAQLREEIAQVGHGDLVVAADIDAPKEGDVDQSAELTSGRLSCALGRGKATRPSVFAKGARWGT